MTDNDHNKIMAMLPSAIERLREALSSKDGITRATAAHSIVTYAMNAANAAAKTATDTVMPHAPTQLAEEPQPAAATEPPPPTPAPSVEVPTP